MQQHPVPQNVTSYEFRLIGDMTLKQFLQLVGGGIVAFIFYSTNLPDIVKWPFVAFSLLLGAGFAFLPLEGRPLDQWLLAFIRAIYKPTQFYWKKNPQLPSFMKSQNPLIPPPTSTENTITSHQKNMANKKRSLDDLLQSNPKNDHAQESSQQIDPKVQAINKLFSESTPTPPPPAKNLPPKKIAPIPIAKTQTGPILKTHQSQTPVGKVKTTPIKNISVVKEESPDSLSSTPIPPPTTTQQPKPAQNVKAVEKVVEKPKTTAFFNPKLPFPSLPETPNTLVGMVYTKSGSIVDNAIIEIQNQHKHTVRATKTNKIGQFFLATPLKEGSYFISIEKNNLIFQSISIKLENKIYPPLEIRATN